MTLCMGTLYVLDTFWAATSIHMACRLQDRPWWLSDGSADAIPDRAWHNDWVSGCLTTVCSGLCTQAEIPGAAPAHATRLTFGS